MQINSVIRQKLCEKLAVILSVSFVAVTIILNILETDWIVQLIEDHKVVWKYSSIMSVISSSIDFIILFGLIFFGTKLDERITLN